MFGRLQSVTRHHAKNAIRNVTDLLNYLLSDAKTFDKKASHYARVVMRDCRRFRDKRPNTVIDLTRLRWWSDSDTDSETTGNEASEGDVEESDQV